MCNLYSFTRGQQAVRALAGVMKDRTGNLPPLPGIFPDYPAPIVRNQPEGRELTMARWGMPSPVFAVKGKNSDPGVTNVRNVASPLSRCQKVPEKCSFARLLPFNMGISDATIPDFVAISGIIGLARGLAGGRPSRR